LNKLKSLLALAAVSSLLTACSQGQSAPPTVVQQNPGQPGYAKLQLAVGTANVAGTTTALNVVSTLRQPNGLSAVLLDTPSLSGPWSLPPAAPAGSGLDPYSTINAGGPSMQDLASRAITGTSQTVHLGTPACDTSGPAPAGFAQCPAGVTPNTTTFGQSGGVFGMGFQPANSTTNTTAYSYVPYAQPIFASSAVAGAAGFLAFGGPPAFHDSVSNMGWRDGLHNLGSGVLGWDQGINVIMLTAPPGTGSGYTLNVSIPTGQGQNGQSSFFNTSAQAFLKTAATLPTVTAPAVTLDGAGGGTVTVTLPAGATEGYVQIVDQGPGGPSCQGALGTQAFPVYYTILVNKPGTNTYTLPDTDGPNTTQTGPNSLTPSPTICTAAQNNAATQGTTTVGDTFTVQYFAMDYPLFEASYPNNSSQTPALLGPAGQADITISATATQTSP